MLVPYGKLIGKRLGDRYPREEMLAEHTNRPGGRMTGMIGNQTLSEDADFQAEHASHPWGIFFTVLGTVLLDFDADACQSPSRAYLLDVTLPGKLKANLFVPLCTKYISMASKAFNAYCKADLLLGALENIQYLM